MFIFNIEHDLCIANGDPHFVPPASALTFAGDCKDVTLWMKGLLDDENKIVPWGWNNVLKCNLLKQGFPDNELPSDEIISEIKRLSHRRVAAVALDDILAHLPNYQWPERQIAASSIKDVLSAISRFDRIVLKSPWSGSGKGLRWVDKSLSESDEGWCRNVIEKQGCVIAERRYEVVQNCAMLFKCDDCVKFAGYSLFLTENGIYRGNLLASDSYIEDVLCRYVDRKELQDVKSELMKYIEHHFQGNYSGYLGVDQFIFREDDKYVFHPVVEINVRMTMGLLARHLYDYYPQFSQEDGALQMKVEHREEPGALMSEFKDAISLCPITPSTKYGIFIVRNPESL